MKDNQHEQLFTELTAEAAAVIEGGRTLSLYTLEATRTNSDAGDGDDPFLLVNGTSFFGATNVFAGAFFNINKDISIGDSASIQLWDDDDLLNGGDDLIGSFVISGSGSLNLSFQNADSTYLLKGYVS